MFGLILLAMALFFASLHLAFLARDRSRRNVARVLLLYVLPVSVGLGGLLAFLGHTFRADEISRSIGWQPGSPFQFEVAVANLAFGVLGMLCVKFRDGFWTATILGYGVFLEGAAYGHIREIVAADNWAVNNAGVILGIDVLFPIVLLGLLILSRTGRGAGQGRTNS